MLTDRRSQALRTLAGTATLAAFFLLSGSAGAHGIGESAAGRTILEFIPLGMEHMLLGWDHLVFIAGVLLLASGIREAAKLISLFVLGHSLTLIVATLAGWQLDATLVDVVIALSLVYVGAQGMASRPADWRVIGATVFGFGLVHGLGLSTRLQDLGIPDDDLLWRVLSFNLGVEIGQLSALIVFFGAGWLAVRFIPAADRERLVPAAFATVLAAGLIGAAVLSFPSEDARDSTEVVAAETGCEEGPTELPPASPGGGHPPKTFYAPGEDVPAADLGHVIGDGYVIVRYSEDLAEDDLLALRQFVESGAQFLVAAPDLEQSEALRATTSQTTLTCREFDGETLAEFHANWMAQITGQPGPG